MIKLEQSSKITLHLSASKPRDSIDLKSVHILNIDRLAIVESRVLSRSLNASYFRGLVLLCCFLLSSLLIQLPIYANPDTAYAQLSSLKTQIPYSTKPAAIIMDSVDLLHNFEVSPKRDKLITKVGGVYFIIASGQCASMNKSDSGQMDLWFVKNSQPIPNSNCRMSVDNPISNSVLITQFLISLSPGDTIGTNFSANAPSLGFVFAQPDNEPANSSFLFSILKIE